MVKRTGLNEIIEGEDFTQYHAGILRQIARDHYCATGDSVQRFTLTYNRGSTLPVYIDLEDNYVPKI